MQITYVIQKSRRRSMSIQVVDDKKIIVKVPLGTPTFVAENFIRLQKSRWGSCSVDGNLNFNCLLVLMPPEILDSVVVHELCHRRHMNHSQKSFMMKCCGFSRITNAAISGSSRTGVPILRE